MRADVVKPHGLFEPEYVERLSARTKALAGWQVPAPVGIDGDRDARTDRCTHGFYPLDVDHRIGVTDLELQPSKAIVFDGASALGDQVTLRNREPADVGVVGFQFLLSGAAEQLPERHAGCLRPEIPKRDIDCSERKVGDAGPADPTHCREIRQLVPETAAFRGVLAEKQRRIALGDACSYEPIGRKVRMRTRKAVSDQSVDGADARPDNSPMRYGVRRIRDRVRVHRDMQDEWLDRLDPQTNGPPVPRPAAGDRRIACACATGAKVQPVDLYEPPMVMSRSTADG